MNETETNADQDEPYVDDSPDEPPEPDTNQADLTPQNAPVPDNADQ